MKPSPSPSASAAARVDAARTVPPARAPLATTSLKRLERETSPGNDAASEKGASADNELLVGGQALIEGVLMRAPGAYGIAVRRPDGSIAIQRAKVASLALRYPALKLPLLRGIAVLFQSLSLGIRALNFSASIALEEAATPATLAASAAPAASADTAGASPSRHATTSAVVERVKPGEPAERAIPEIVERAAPETVERAIPETVERAAPETAAPATGDASGWALAGSLAIGLGLAAVVFLLVPLWLTQLGERHLFGPLSSLAFNLVDGGLRALFFLAYIFAISRFKDIHRVFMYHGAEHKVVFVHEKRLPLTVDNARRQSRLHPRCGTSFLLFVLLVSILVFALIPKSAPFLVKFGGRLLLVPLLAGLSYEVLRLTAKRRAAPLFAALVFPGLMLQKITTQEPTDDMLEVAIAALAEALREDGLLPEASLEPPRHGGEAADPASFGASGASAAGAPALSPSAPELAPAAASSVGA